MSLDPKLLETIRASFADQPQALVVGAPVHEGQVHSEPLIRLPLAMMNRHGLIAGATGTGKTKTLQVLAEQLSAAGVPVFVADVKGDLAGLAVPGEPTARTLDRAQSVGVDFSPRACPVEMLSLTGDLGAQLRATVSSFGPLALAKVLELNATQTSVLTLVFKYCDDKGLPLLDFADLRSVLMHLGGAGASDLASFGGMSKASLGVLLRQMVELEQQGAGKFFGEPEFELEDLLDVLPNGRGRVSILALADVQDRPALFSTFMMWLLARLYNELPEVGDLDKPKLVFFFDEAHLLFKNASASFMQQVESVVRLIRSKGVGIFFITQNPKDVPPAILGQLGSRVQHALRAFTPDDDKALKAAARTFPKTAFYDVPETLTTLGIGEALVSVLMENGAPSAPVVTRVAPPMSRMGPPGEAELQALLRSPQVRRYAQTIDRDSAHEMLARRMAPANRGREVDDDDEVDTEAYGEPERPRRKTRSTSDEGNEWGDILNSPLARTIAGQVTRGLMGALLGSPRRRRRR